MNNSENNPNNVANNPAFFAISKVNVSSSEAFKISYYSNRALTLFCSVLHTFPMALMRRICLTGNTFFTW